MKDTRYLRTSFAPNLHASPPQNKAFGTPDLKRIAQYYIGLHIAASGIKTENKMLAISVA